MPRSSLANDAQFVADAMLGSSRMVAVMGIDVMYDPDAIDVQLLQRAERRGRIF